MIVARQTTPGTRPRSRRAPALLALGLGLVAGLTACGGGGPTTEAAYPTRRTGASDIVYSNQPRETIWGESSGMWLFGSSRTNQPGGDGSGGGGAGIGVNTFLWRASLDTLSFMPMAQVDPFGGVIITDWYSAPQQPGERMKVNIFILDRTLRADGVRAAVFRQRRDGQGAWVDAPVDAKTGIELEDAILTRARQMRLGMAAQ
ncbi:uncharacterized protein DUF3576 [Stella humosa]|uniref:Uncharacterized protein DUF3576 n=1 Tax=Stella humosa TaxID=94 RepID=A0A3N1LI44_9PROT|nr:DUF3576 domain-containing protein [Stella humosa]ROP90940.1 uncharacterized protein DUF3576 [Stella humosa]BBK34710.1 hypothetical protein STHU_53440 [Stella humosa]